jgi:chromosome partitioning protein
MSAVVTVMNMKGGVGKTTISVNFAGVMSKYNIGGKPASKVLVVDYDPQFNLSQAFIPSKTYFSLEKDEKTTLSVLIGSGKNLNPYKLQVPGNHTPPKIAELATNLNWLQIYSKA